MAALTRRFERGLLVVDGCRIIAEFCVFTLQKRPIDAGRNGIWKAVLKIGSRRQKVCIARLTSPNYSVRIAQFATKPAVDRPGPYHIDDFRIVQKAFAIKSRGVLRNLERTGHALRNRTEISADRL